MQQNIASTKQEKSINCVYVFAPSFEMHNLLFCRTKKGKRKKSAQCFFFLLLLLCFAFFSRLPLPLFRCISSMQANEEIVRTHAHTHICACTKLIIKIKKKNN